MLTNKKNRFFAALQYQILGGLKYLVFAQIEINKQKKGTRKSISISGCSNSNFTTITSNVTETATHGSIFLRYIFPI